MNGEKRRSIFKQAKCWVEEAGFIIRNKINDDLKIDTKLHEDDLVTEVDREIEKYFVEKIKEKYPDHLILGEEGYGDNVTSTKGTIWIVDPIDGTKNFIHQKKNFAISVGIYQDGVGEVGLIYDVMADVLYSAIREEGAYRNGEKINKLKIDTKLEKAIFSFKHELLCKSEEFNAQVIEDLVTTIRGVRYGGTASLEIAQVVAGTSDAYISQKLSPWDIAAGIIILTEVGGVAFRSNGEAMNILETGTVVVCNEVLKERILDSLQGWHENKSLVHD